jgi:NAD(P)-dependent dehydrogenase (short-subunit alcohol dehydrogenase family)
MRALQEEFMSVVLVSGCSTGIGRAVAERFARAGHVVVAGARDPATLTEARALHPERLHPIDWDVADAASTRRAVEGTIGRFGRIDVLVNNAGYGQMGPLVELTREAWRRQIETNVVGLADAAALAARLPGGMIARRAGRIVNIGSILGRFSIPFSGAYSATKHAVEAISDTLRMELAPFGIDVILVEPGPITTVFTTTARRSLEEILARRDSPYEYLRPDLQARFDAPRGTAMSADSCAAIIVGAAMRRRPPTRLRMTGVARIMFWVRRLLSDRLLDALLKPRYGLDREAPGGPATSAPRDGPKA